MICQHCLADCYAFNTFSEALEPTCEESLCECPEEQDSVCRACNINTNHHCGECATCGSTAEDRANVGGCENCMPPPTA